MIKMILILHPRVLGRLTVLLSIYIENYFNLTVNYCYNINRCVINFGFRKRIFLY